MNLKKRTKFKPKDNFFRKNLKYCPNSVCDMLVDLNRLAQHATKADFVLLAKENCSRLPCCCWNCWKRQKLKLETQERSRWWKLPTLNSKTNFVSYLSKRLVPPASLSARIADRNEKKMANAVLKYQNQVRSDCQQMPKTEDFGKKLLNHFVGPDLEICFELLHGKEPAFLTKRVQKWSTEESYLLLKEVVVLIRVVKWLRRKISCAGNWLSYRYYNQIRRTKIPSLPSSYRAKIKDTENRWEEETFKKIRKQMNYSL